MFNTPVLFLLFNRPDTTKQVFEVIRQIKPVKLFIAADGPREDREGEVELCRKTREIVLNGIDWDCDVMTLFQNNNLGCGKAVSGAITWFFDHVEEGIILEDDCLPNLSFFSFCSELLEKYRHNERIMILSGFNPMIESKSFTESYTFSMYSGIWGWATWERAWSKYNYTIPEWHNSKIREQVLSSFKNQKDAGALENGLDAVIKLKCDTWDYQWGFYRTLHDGLGIVPRYNLISNIGFRLDATHTVTSHPVIENLAAKAIEFPLQHPHIVLSNESFNNEYNLLFERSIITLKKSILKKMLKHLNVFK